MNKGVIVWKGDLGSPPNNYSKSTVEGVLTEAALTTLATALAAHSTAVVARTSYNALTVVTSAAPGVSANVDEKCTVFMQDPSNLHLVSIDIPAILAASMESIDNTQFKRMKAAALAEVVAAINTATGRGLAALYGKANTR